ncbi:hypothetical protein PIB30_060047 [Stylosanthes scabra]|uniref:Uncharacterized protein n=1 Tax=Stylosanthes scabra TaxID=79078 RepID=A0ABU6XJ11_9FABA|nr:hypothetical protein [Stylosanthes scabra]
MLKRWERKEADLEKELDEVCIRLQIWGLPEHCKTEKLGQKIASCMGEVVECSIFETSKEKTRFINATVRMKIHTPFRKGVNVGSRENRLSWADDEVAVPALQTRLIRNSLSFRKQESVIEGEPK